MDKHDRQCGGCSREGSKRKPRTTKADARTNGAASEAQEASDPTATLYGGDTVNLKSGVAYGKDGKTYALTEGQLKALRIVGRYRPSPRTE